MNSVTIDIEDIIRSHSSDGNEVNPANFDDSENRISTHEKDDVSDFDRSEIMVPKVSSIDLGAVDMKNGYVDEVISHYSHEKKTSTDIFKHETHVLVRQDAHTSFELL